MNLAAVVNPASGRGRGKRALEAIRAAFPSIPIHETQGPGDAERMARALSGCDTVIASGGDGTLGEVANGLRDSGAVLACVPGGTGNDLCRTLGIGTSIDRALEAVRAGRVHSIDAGECEGQLFLDTMSCGFDACVGVRINRGYRWVGGTAAYVLALVQELGTFVPRDLVLTVDGARFEHQAMLVAVANAQSYGGGMMIAPQARIDDGMLDVVVVARISRLELLRQFPKVFRGAHLGHPSVFAYRGREITVDVPAQTPVLLDGEMRRPGGFSARVVPGAVRVALPPG